MNYETSYITPQEAHTFIDRSKLTTYDWQMILEKVGLPTPGKWEDAMDWARAYVTTGQLVLDPQVHPLYGETWKQTNEEVTRLLDERAKLKTAAAKSKRDNKLDELYWRLDCIPAHVLGRLADRAAYEEEAIRKEVARWVEKAEETAGMTGQMLQEGLGRANVALDRFDSLLHAVELGNWAERVTMARHDYSTWREALDAIRRDAEERLKTDWFRTQRHGDKRREAAKVFLNSTKFF